MGLNAQGTTDGHASPWLGFHWVFHTGINPQRTWRCPNLPLGALNPQLMAESSLGQPWVTKSIVWGQSPGVHQHSASTGD